MVKGLDDLAPEGLLDRARKAANLVDDAARVRIFCHYDPDGTTSASILARALMRRGKRIHATMAHALDRTSAARLREESNELLVVSDMGSGQLDLLEGLPYPVVVLDHHKPIRDSETIAHVNPHFFGVDGAREMCGATTTWLFALVLDERPRSRRGRPTKAHVDLGRPTRGATRGPGSSRRPRGGSILDRTRPDVRPRPRGVREQL